MELQFYHEEFEYEVRSQLHIFDRAITDSDAANITELDLSDFDFLTEDHEALSHFKNLVSLSINIGYTTPDFWANFPKMQKLFVTCWGDKFDFMSFQKMADLEALTVSGGDVSSIPYVNLEALLDLQKLTSLELHEFGTVDIQPLRQMKQLKSFALRYANKAKNIDSIGSMRFLDELVLDGLFVENLDFLDLLPDKLRIEMCGVHVYGGIEVSKWKRFMERDICEISVGDHILNFIDLSTLD